MAKALMPTNIKLNGFTGVNWDDKATLIVSPGPTYHEIILETNLTPDQIERVEVNLNGDDIYQLTGAELKMLEAYKKRPAVEGLYIIPFADIVGKNLTGSEYTALVTLPGDNLTLNVKIGQPADSANPGTIKLAAHAVVAESQPVRVLIPRIKTETMQATAEGDNEYMQLLGGFGPNKYLKRLHLKSAKISGIEIQRDRIQIYHNPSKAVNNLLLSRSKLAPQNGYWHFDPVRRGFLLQDLLEVNAGFEFKTTVTTTEALGSLRMLAESVLVVRPDLLGGSR